MLGPGNLAMDGAELSTITVDSYTTLVDVDAQEAVLTEYVDGLSAPESVSRTWRSRAIQYTMIANDIDAYRPFSDLLGLALDYALQSHGHDIEPSTRAEIRTTVYEERLAVFDDVQPGLERLVEMGYPVYILSNGDPTMLQHLIDAASLDGIVSGAISADGVRIYKPDPGIYRHAADQTGTDIGEILHVSGGSMRDVWGAKHAGMRTAWVNRPAKHFPRESLGMEPDMEVESFLDLADRLTASSEP